MIKVKHYMNRKIKKNNYVNIIMNINIIINPIMIKDINIMKLLKKIYKTLCTQFLYIIFLI